MHAGVNAARTSIPYRLAPHAQRAVRPLDATVVGAPWERGGGETRAVQHLQSAGSIDIIEPMLDEPTGSQGGFGHRLGRRRQRQGANGE
jgi:hypothetical protein